MRLELAALLCCGICAAFLGVSASAKPQQQHEPFSQEFRSVAFDSDSDSSSTSDDVSRRAFTTQAVASAAGSLRLASTESGGDDDDDDEESDAAHADATMAGENEWEPCPKDMFMRSAGKCHPCSMCGPDLYVRRACSARRDTTCDWCLNPTPRANADFRAHCADIIQLQREFNTLLEKRHVRNGKQSLITSFGSSDASASSSSADESGNDEFVAESRIRISVVSPVYGGLEEEEAAANSYRFARLRSLISASYKMELLLEACLYLALVALLFVVVRFVAKSRPKYRTITVNPPVLDDTDKKNIIRAADEIREKIGKKGYNRLEEFL